jgi:type IV pilus assembly protein PilA
MPKVKYPIFKCLHRGEKGFTLIELLIVVAILGIIAAVVIPNISRFMITGQLSAANSEAEQVKTSALGYFGEYGLWPDNSDVLTTTGYITGNLKATYEISGDGDAAGAGTGTGYGWLMSSSNQSWSDEIEFTGANDGADGNHGTWVRKVTP